jgi:aspartate oxidase
MIRSMVLDYRSFARQQLKEEFPSIAAQVQTQRLDALNAAVQ